MTPIFRFEGIYTPVVTPYLPDGTPDRDALSDVIDFLIEAGVHGLISGGSTVTGKRFLGCSAESNAKEVVLEMGDKNPAIVMDDAENLDRVAQHIVNGATGTWAKTARPHRASSYIGALKTSYLSASSIT